MSALGWLFGVFALLGWGLGAFATLALVHTREDLAELRGWARGRRTEPPPLPTVALTQPIPLRQRWRTWTRAWRTEDELPAFLPPDALTKPPKR